MSTYLSTALRKVFDHVGIAGDSGHAFVLVKLGGKLFVVDAWPSGKPAVFPLEVAMREEPGVYTVDPEVWPEVRSLTEAGQLLEFISNPLIWFKNYLSMTDEQKREDLARVFAWQYGDYAEDEGLEVPPEYEHDNYGFVEKLPDDQVQRFGAWLDDNVDRGDTTENPAWMYMDFEGIVKNDWLIHLTDDPVGIEKHGFKYGLEDFQEIAYTKHRKRAQITDPDYAYCFAYTLGDFDRHARRTGFGGGTYKYGDEAVVFRASGVRIWHYGDEEPQVIFLAGSAKDIVGIHESGEGGYWISGGKRGELFKADSIEDCAYWVTNNYDQYRRAIS